jgi:hypothetical protein
MSRIAVLMVSGQLLRLRLLRMIGQDMVQLLLMLLLLLWLIATVRVRIGWCAARTTAAHTTQRGTY